MADGYDRFDNESGGSSFVMGLLTGTVLGAGLGMLFAPKSGAELRNQLSEQAGNIANTASEGYRRASETASEWADRGREVYDKARDAAARGVDEASRYVREATSGPTPSATPAGSTGPSVAGGSTGSSYGTGSTYPSGSENIRGVGDQGTSGGSRRS